VMYAGKAVEVADVREIFHHPRHPYTLGLISSLPRLDTELQRLVPIPGQPPSLLHPPPGCSFHPRCAVYQGRERCRTEEPPLYRIGGGAGAAVPRSAVEGHRSACHFHDEVPAHAASLSRQLGTKLTGGDA
jgi:oligopeptide/dipeptide ABC transporter ATP-binding protein